MIALATIALLASSGDAFSISNSRMRSDTSLQMAGSKKKIVITGILMHILVIVIVISLININIFM
jgi:hypothetical protein